MSIRHTVCTCAILCALEPAIICAYAPYSMCTRHTPCACAVFYALHLEFELDLHLEMDLDLKFDSGFPKFTQIFHYFEIKYNSLIASETCFVRVSILHLFEKSPHTIE